MFYNRFGELNTSFLGSLSLVAVRAKGQINQQTGVCNFDVENASVPQCFKATRSHQSLLSRSVWTFVSVRHPELDFMFAYFMHGVNLLAKNPSSVQSHHAWHAGDNPVICVLLKSGSRLHKVRTLLADAPSFLLYL